MQQDHNNNILQYITKALKSPDEWRLTLEDCNINDDILNTITSIIKKSKIIASSININLKNNIFTSKCITPFLDALKNHIINREPNTVKMTIDFSGNNIDTMEENYCNTVMEHTKNLLIDDSTIMLGEKTIGVRNNNVFISIRISPADNANTNNIITDDIMTDDKSTSFELINNNNDEKMADLEDINNSVPKEKNTPKKTELTHPERSDVPTIWNKITEIMTLENIYSFSGYLNIGLTVTNTVTDTIRGYVFGGESNKITFLTNILKVSGIGVAIYGSGFGMYILGTGVTMQIMYDLYRKDDYTIENAIVSTVAYSSFTSISQQFTEIMKSQNKSPTVTDAKKFIVTFTVATTLTHSYTTCNNINKLRKELQNKEETKELISSQPDIFNDALSKFLSLFTKDQATDQQTTDVNSSKSESTQQISKENQENQTGEMNQQESVNQETTDISPENKTQLAGETPDPAATNNTSVDHLEL